MAFFARSFSLFFVKSQNYNYESHLINRTEKCLSECVFSATLIPIIGYFKASGPV